MGSSGGSDDGDGTVPAPRGTTQVVTCGKLIVIIAGLDRWQVRIRGTRYCGFGYEVAVWQWRLRDTVAARDPSQSLGSSRMVTCHLAIGGSGLSQLMISCAYEGLIEAVKEFMPHVEHRQCARFTTSKVLITIFSLVGQFCDADLEVAFRKSTCFVRELQGNDLLTGNHGTDLYTISLQETSSSTPIYLMAKASPTQAWLWHRRLFHLNFDYINLLSKKDVVIGLPKTEVFKELICSSCEVSTAKTKYHSSQRCFKFKSRVEFASNDIVWSNAGLLDQMGRIYSEICKAPVISVRTGRGTEFLNKTLNVFFKEEGIEHQTSTPRTPEQNCVVERQNRTLVEAARYKMKEKDDLCILVGYSTQSKGYRVYNKITNKVDS
ncbi:retrovirus-related pol polyprotein from transposon TNT 1-94 [Tanacetum coccineum]